MGRFAQEKNELMRWGMLNDEDREFRRVGVGDLGGLTSVEACLCLGVAELALCGLRRGEERKCATG